MRATYRSAVQLAGLLALLLVGSNPAASASRIGAVT